MERDTFTGSIRAYKQHVPFQPFTVVTVSGGRYEVDHPEAVAVRDGLALFAAPGNVPVIFNHQGVSEVIGDLADRPAGNGQNPKSSLLRCRSDGGVLRRALAAVPMAIRR